MTWTPFGSGPSPSSGGEGRGPPTSGPIYVGRHGPSVNCGRPSARRGPGLEIQGPQCAFEMSMFMCPAVHMSARNLLRSSSTHEPSDPPFRVVYPNLQSEDRAGLSCAFTVTVRVVNRADPLRRWGGEGMRHIPSRTEQQPDLQPPSPPQPYKVGERPGEIRCL